MHYLYIIYSKKLGKFYIGETPNVLIRLKLHNTHHFAKSFTKSATDWEVKLAFECVNKVNALFLEKFIKRMKSKKFIEKIIDNPLMLKDILEKNNP